jgi:hypothetical protein
MSSEVWDKVEIVNGLGKVMKYPPIRARVERR